MSDTIRTLGAALLAASAALGASNAASASDADIVAALDTRYQAAVKINDADAMAAILHDDMVLVIGRGTVITRTQLVDSARARTTTYEEQDEEDGTQIVRMFGPDTAVVTAKLWLKGQTGGQPFDRKLWFSDTYVRTPTGWKYAFGQASIALPAE